MNTHDIDIELPPLPTPDADHYDNGTFAPVWKQGKMEAYARAAIEADRKHRGEPVAWIYEDELPNNYPYDTMFPYSKIDGVRMFPVYAPQPAEPVKVRPETLSEHIARDIREGRFPGKSERKMVPAEPVKVPSEAQEIRRLYRAIYKVMERLGEMLDKEQYGVIDRLLTDEGVEPPSTPEPPTSD